MSNNFGYLNKYPKKDIVESNDNIAGVDKNDEIKLFSLPAMAEYMRNNVNVNANIIYNRISLGSVGGLISSAVNNSASFIINNSEVTIIERIHNGKQELFLFTAPKGEYGFNKTQTVEDYFILIEKEYLSVETDPIYESDKPFLVRNDKDNRLVGNLTIDGDVFVNGTKFIQNETDLVVKDSIILLNNGEKGNGVTGKYSGFNIDRGQKDNYFAGIEENADVSTPLFKVGEFNSTDGIIQSLLNNTFKVEDSETIDFTGKKVRFTKDGEENKFGTIESYNPTTKIATLKDTVFGLDTTWTYRILYNVDLYPVALWDDKNISNDCILYWDSASMLLKDAGVKKDTLLALKKVATTGKYNDLLDKPVLDTTLSNISMNAVQGNAIKKYIDDSSVSFLKRVDLSIQTDGSSLKILNTAGNDIILPTASLTMAGLLQASDKKKISDLKTVAMSGSYLDLTNSPVTINNNQSESIAKNDVYRKIKHIPLSQKGATDGVAKINGDITKDFNAKTITGTRVLGVDFGDVTGGQQAIDNIKIGGRNLVHMSIFDGIIRATYMSRYEFNVYSNDIYHHFNDANDDVFNVAYEANTQYTLSLTGKGVSATSTGAGFYFRVKYTDGTTDNIIIYNKVNPDYKRYTLTSDANKTISKIIVTYGQGARIHLKDIMLTKGAVDVDWTPAPEDKADNAAFLSKTTHIDANGIYTGDTIIPTYDAVPTTPKNGQLAVIKGSPQELKIYINGAWKSIQYS